MERGKRIESAHGEIPLPEAVIQNIQSLLNGKEAARTSILSKSWYNAWATRHILVLDQRNLRFPGGAGLGSPITEGFLEYSKKIMRRYDESNLTIDNFKLCMDGTETGDVLLASDLILKAMKLSATDLNFEFLSQFAKFDLPNEVLGYENFVKLSLSGCRIDPKDMGGKLGCKKLKSLSLNGVCIVGVSSLDLISSCPLIEEVVLSKCICSYTVRISNGDIADITRMLALRSLTDFGRPNVRLTVDSPIIPFDNLKCLFLEKIRIDELIFCDTSKGFPRLKDLTLHHCNGFMRLQISSPSLECLSIAHMTVLSAKFDVPRLRKFGFSGKFIPFLSFETASSEWETNISVTHSQDHIRSSWLVRLKNLLMKLSMSKISLSLCFKLVNGEAFIDLGYGYVQDLPKPVVENLMLSMDAPTSVCPLLLKGVFWSCRPKFVTHDWSPSSLDAAGQASIGLLKLLCESLIQEESEKADVEVFEDRLAEWVPLPWQVLLDASKSPEKVQQIRFKLSSGLER